MIHRNCQAGLKLDVAGLNEITVLIDRAESELTEAAMNTWRRDLDGPPHHHAHKEQAFYVTSGQGLVRLGDDEYPAEPGSLFYVPAGMIHQTITKGSEPLAYFLFNAFLDSSKEGHASFAEHIKAVKETRRQQALTQKAAPENDAPAPSVPKNAKAVPPKPVSEIFSQATLVHRIETQRIEIVALDLPSNHPETPLTDRTKEQTLLVTKGSGSIRINNDIATLTAGEIIFIPRDSSVALLAGSAGFHGISFGVVIGN